MSKFTENKIIKLIKHKNNIVLYGPNGCGKSTIIQKITEIIYNDPDLNIDLIYTTIYDYEDIKFIFLIIENYIKEYVKNLAKYTLHTIDEESIKIKKFYDIHDILEDLEYFNLYIIIDQINDINTFNRYSNQIKKIHTFEKHIKLILVSNFNLKYSELIYGFDFSSFIDIEIDRITIEEYETLVKNKFHVNDIDINKILRLTIGNFYNSFINPNDYIYCVGCILSEYDIDNNNFSIEKQINKYNNKIHSKDISENSISNKLTISDNISPSQKLLLFSAFLASYSSSKIDHLLFRNVKKIRSKRYRKNRKRLEKVFFPFNIHRLLAIYSSISQEVEIKSIDIELISDINTLINMNLIRSISSDYNYLSRKFLVCISIDFAKELGEELKLRLDEFINMDHVL